MVVIVGSVFRDVRGGRSMITQTLVKTMHHGQVTSQQWGAFEALNFTIILDYFPKVSLYLTLNCYFHI